MRRELVFALLVLLVAGVYFVQGAPAQPVEALEEEQTNQISVTGEAVITAEPDYATIRLEVRTDGDTAQQVGAENADLMDAVIAALIKEGIPENQIDTANYRIWQTYENIQPIEPLKGEAGAENERKIIFHCANTVVVETDELERAGEFIDIALHAGANIVEGVSFGLKDSDALQLEALGEATRDARQKAETIAEAAKVTIIGIKNIIEQNVYYRSGYYDGSKFGLGEMAAGAPTPIQPSDVRVEASVRMEVMFAN